MVERFGLYILNSFTENKIPSQKIHILCMKYLCISYTNTSRTWQHNLRTNPLWFGLIFFMELVNTVSVKCEFKIKIILLAKSWIFAHLLPIFINIFMQKTMKKNPMENWKPKQLIFHFRRSLSDRCEPYYCFICGNY